MKYFACNVARLGAGRGIGTDLAVWTGVAPAFPPASRLSTPSPARAPPSRRSSVTLRSTASTHSATALWRSLPRFACQTMHCFAIHPPKALRAPNRKTSINMPEIQKQNHTRLALACHLQKASTPGTCGNATPLTFRLRARRVTGWCALVRATYGWSKGRFSN